MSSTFIFRPNDQKKEEPQKPVNQSRKIENKAVKEQILSKLNHKLKTDTNIINAVVDEKVETKEIYDTEIIDENEVDIVNNQEQSYLEKEKVEKIEEIEEGTFFQGELTTKDLNHKRKNNEQLLLLLVLLTVLKSPKKDLALIGTLLILLVS